MRWRSNNDSARQGQPSFLAIIETVVAVVVGALVVWRTNWSQFVLYQSLFAPFLLLQNAYSRRWSLFVAAKILNTPIVSRKTGFQIESELRARGDLLLGTVRRWFVNRIEESITYLKESAASGGASSWNLSAKRKILLSQSFLYAIGLLGVVAFFLLILGLIIVFLLGVSVLIIILIRMATLICSVLYAPITAFSEIPENWRRIVACTDSFTLPEIVPGIESSGNEQLNGIKISFWISSHSKLLEDVRGASENMPRIVVHAMFLPFYVCMVLVFLIIYLSALSHRISLKSTALYWSPLLWYLSPIASLNSLRAFIRQFTEYSYQKFVRFYSLIPVVFLGVKFGAAVAAVDLLDSLPDISFWKAANRFLILDEWPLWQIVAAMNGLITWCIYFRADALKTSFDPMDKKSEERYIKIFKVLILVRNLLSVYIMACSMYLFWTIVENTPIPRIRYFPWASITWVADFRS